MAIADQLDRLNVLRQNLAAALTAKSVEAAETEGFETLVPKVGTIETGVQLPELTNPAGAENIQSGYEVIDGEGNLLAGTGELYPLDSEWPIGDVLMDTAIVLSSVVYTLDEGWLRPTQGTGRCMKNQNGVCLYASTIDNMTDIASASEILSGKKAWGKDGKLMDGSYTPPTLTDLLPTLSNPATAADIASGKQAINAAGEVVEGEYTPPTPRHLNVGLGEITAGDSISYILPDKDMLLVETSYNAATSEWNYVVYKVENGTITRESMFHGGRVSFTRQSNGLKFYVFNTTSKEIRGITIWAYVKE